MSKKIAIIGSGISGISCAWLLQKDHDITLFEKNNYIGGHSNTASIQYDGESEVNVDTGFIVFNFRTYPNLKAFFELLGVEIMKSNMSFGIKNLDNNLEYCGSSLAGLFAQKKNLLNPRFLRMIKDILKFNKTAIEMIESGVDFGEMTLFEFINKINMGEYFRDYYLLPMAGAIWSCPVETIKNYPAATFLQFFYNHGLLTVKNQPQWYTVKGGSKEYVKKMVAEFRDKIKLGCTIKSARKSVDKVILTDQSGEEYEFDDVIFASHGDQTHTMISDKTPEEEAILGAIKYSQNVAVLHKDPSQMPTNQKAWASWVYLSKKSEDKVSLTYWMNNLQGIDETKPLFVTLNPIEEVNKSDIFGTYYYEHPIFDNQTIKAQEQLHTIQGKRNMWFCGAWTKYGFHEDGLNSAIEVAKHFGITPPWNK